MNGKNYIGQTSNASKRWSQHKKESERDTPRMIINKAMKKYGIHNFIFEVIATCKTLDDANEIETLLVHQYQSHISFDKGYNVSLGGSNAPKTEEWKRKVATANTGKKRSAEICLRMSISRKGRPSWNKGKKSSLETRRKISEIQIGRKLSESTKMKMSKSHSGKKLTDDHKKKLSISKTGNLNPNFGKQESEETKKKRSLAYQDKRHPNYGKPSPSRTPVSTEQLEIILSSKLSDRKLAKLLGLSRGVVRRVLKGNY